MRAVYRAHVAMLATAMCRRCVEEDVRVGDVDAVGRRTTDLSGALQAKTSNEAM
jgi:hypothetical protein